MTSPRRPAEQRLGTLGHEQEPAVGVASVDDVRRGLDELAEARLGLAELALQALALAHVADRAVRAERTGRSRRGARSR